MIAGFGVYAIESIRDTSGLVTRTYDKPLMAINFARSAQFEFATIDHELARVSLTRDPEQRQRHLRRIENLRRTFDDDLKVAEERSLSQRSVAVIHDIRDLTDQWHAIREEMLRNGLDTAKWTALDDMAVRIVDKFNMLIDLSAGDGFLIRQDALKAIDRSRLANTGAVAGILLASLVLIVLLSRSILGPLGAAARVADRISRGELNARIPRHGNDETGALLCSLEVMQDNLRAMMAQEVALRKSAQAQLADALESSSDGVILIDASDLIVIVNKRVHDFLPQVAHLFQPGMSFYDAMRETQARGLTEMFTTYDTTQAMTDRAHYPAPPRAHRLNDGRWLNISRSAARNGGTVVIWSDITELKDREDTLKAAKEQAEKASEAKTNFLANISHELRTPLNAVIGFSELIAHEAFGPLGNPHYSAYAKDIRSSGNHLLGIINDILDMAHSEAGRLVMQPEPVDFAAVARDCLKFIEHQCVEAGHTLVVDMPERLPKINADTARIRQILLNLTSNAIKFTPAGGRIEFAARQSEDGGIDFSVADSGIGMQREDLMIAVEPFRQVDAALSRKYEGTGLGLPLTKMLVELHNGSLEIESSPGRGTRVTVHLPPNGASASVTELKRGAA